MKETVIVTGANGGIGREIAFGLAERGFHVVLACRSRERGERVRQQMLSNFPGSEPVLMTLDLSDFSSIVRFIDDLKKINIHPRILVNNAGVMCKDCTFSVHGMETTLATNYMGVYLLSRLVLPMMGNNGRIVNTVSCTYRLGRIGPAFFDGTDVRRYERFRAYGNSKRALLLFTAELADRVGNGWVAAADPGVADTGMITMHQWFDPLTDILFRPFIKSAGQGARAALAAVDYQGEDAGRYIFHSRCRRKIPAGITGHPYRRWLWEETERRFSEVYGIDLPQL